MTDLWMPGTTVRDIGDHAPTDGGPAKAIAHITWDRNASAAKPADLVPYENLAAYFSGGGKGVAPHILWDPFTGRFTQFVPADSRSKSLVDQSGGTRTNRAGKYVIQVEALFFPFCRVDSKIYAKLSDTPCKGWDRLNAWTRSLGILDNWPMGHPVNFDPNRSESTWETHGGWYGHQQVPENDHQDPGSWPNFVAVARPAPKPVPHYAAFPGSSFFRLGRVHPLITAMGKRLVAEGYKGYKVGPGPKFSRADMAAYSWFQKKLGYSGSDADGIPGAKSWSALKVPQV